LRWLQQTSRSQASPLDRHRLGTILSVLARAPAAAPVARRLFEVCREGSLQGIETEIGDLHYEALLALALADTTKLGGGVFEYFAKQLRIPGYAVAAFTGLRRLNLGQSINYVPSLGRTLLGDGASVAQPLWRLFAAMETDPDAATKLGEVLGRRKSFDVLPKVMEMLRVDLRIWEDFRRAWDAFLDGLCAEVLRQFDQGGVAPGVDVLLTEMECLSQADPEAPPISKTVRDREGILRLARYEALGGRADLDAAVVSLENVAVATPQSSAGWAGVQTNYAVALIRRYEASGDTTNLVFSQS
jgi:hypothetical protein